MEHIRKTWGIKKNIYQDDLSEVSILYLEPNRRCSWHAHRSKVNRFYVVEGKVGIMCQFGSDDGQERALTILDKGDMPFDVFPPDAHEFRTYDEPCILLEVMFVKYDCNDIMRASLGGPLVNKSKKEKKDGKSKND